MVYIITELSGTPELMRFHHEVYVHSWSYKFYNRHYTEPIYKNKCEALTALQRRKRHFDPKPVPQLNLS